jgi:hypothetical protein
MAGVTLRDQLAALQKSSQTRLQEIEAERETCQAEREAIQVEIHRLLERHRDLRETLTSLETEKEKLVTHYVRQGFETVQKALEQSYANLRQTGDYWLAWSRLYDQRRTLLEKDPELGTLFKDYRQLEENLEDALSQLPDFYRKSLLAKHEQVRERVTPYKELIEEARRVQCSQPVTLELALFHDPAAGQIHWVFPYRKDPQLPDEEDDALYGVAATVIQEIARFEAQPEWVFDEATEDEWAGYEALSITGEYTGEQNLVNAAQELLRAQLAEMTVFRGTVLAVHVTGILQEIWDLGREWKADEPPPTGEPEVVTEKLPALIEVTRGWYCDADVESWERPLNVVPGSLWNVQARRLRTLLIRMVAKGKVGMDTVATDQLWKNLPAFHGERLAEGVNRLMDAGMLVESTTTPENGPSVTLNSEMIAEVQNLINRDVTPFWAGLIGTEED